MKGKIFKWTAALAVALTLAGGAAGLSPAPVSLSDYSITAEAASSYLVSNSTLYLWGTETYQPSKLPSGCSPESITGIVLGDGAEITFEERLVNYFPNLEEADFSKATVKGLSGLFSGISSLKNVSLYETNLNSFSELFAECYNLETVDLRIAAGQEVYFVDKMFHNCYNLTSIRWNSNFNTSSARSAEKMFCGCASLEYVDLSLLDLKRVSNTVSMFEDCYSLKELDLNCLNSSKIDFWNEDYWLRMFYHCNSLNKLSLPAGFRVQCTMGLPDSANNTSEDLKGWADSDDLYTAVTYDASISYGSTYRAAVQYSNVSFTEPFTLYRRGDWIDKGSCYYYDRVNYVLHLFGNVDRDEVYYMDGAKNVTEVWCEEGTVFPYNCNGLFMYCHKLKKADLNNADTSGVGNMSNMFCQCDSLEEINICKIDTSNVYTMEYMFAYCTSLEYFYNNNSRNRWNTKNVKYFNQMFAYCTSLREVRADFESNVITSVEGMFNNCGNLEMIILDENGFDLRGVEDAEKANMFADCSNLTSLYLSSNFGGITQNMKLRNDGGGWCDATRNGIQVSGTAQYAEIDDRIAGLTIFHAEKFPVINLDQTFTVSDAPVVGFTNYGLEEGVTCNSTAFKIDKDLSGWYDASTGKKMKTEFFQPGGAYYLRILLDPEFQYRFDGITAENIAKIKLKFTYKDKQFADVVAAGVTVNGLLDIYAVVDSGSQTNAISMTEGSFEGAKEQCYRKDLPSYCVFKYNYSSSQQFLHCYKLPILTCTTFCFTNYYDARFLYPTYLEYVGLEMDDYEYSIGDRAYKPFTVSSAWIPTGVLPGTEYKVAFRRKNQSKPFKYSYIVSRSIGQPVEDNYTTATDVKHFDLTFSAHTVALNNNLGCVYYVPAADLEGYENIKLLIQKEIFDGSGNVSYTMEEVRDYSIQDAGYGDEYIFEYKKIAAKEIASNLYAVIYAEKDGNVYTNMYDRYSVVDYAMKKLNSAKTPRALAVLCADMLNYGAAAQTHFGYHTSNLANSTMTAAHQALATNPNTLQLKSDTKVVPLNGTATAKFSGKTLELGNNISLVFLMQFDDDVDKNNVSLKLSYKTITGQSMSDTIPFSEFEKCEKLYQGKPEYRYSYNRVRAKDAAQPVTATILINGKPASDTLTYSVQSYAKAKLDNSETSAKLKTIIKALMVYCKSAEAYFKS